MDVYARRDKISRPGYFVLRISPPDRIIYCFRGKIYGDKTVIPEAWGQPSIQTHAFTTHVKYTVLGEGCIYTTHTQSRRSHTRVHFTRDLSCECRWNLTPTQLSGREWQLWRNSLT